MTRQDITDTIKNLSLAKKVILVGILVVVLAGVAFGVFLTKHNSTSGSSVEYSIATVSETTMTERLTAAGNATAGAKEIIRLTKGKTMKAVAVEMNQMVSKGDPLVYYSDGSHTDADFDGIVTDIVTVESGDKVSESDNIKIRSISKMYISVMIPENDINNIAEGNEAEITVNAVAGKRFSGRIVEIKAMKKSSGSDDEDYDDEDSDDESDDDMDSKGESIYAFDENESHAQEPSLDSDEDSDENFGSESDSSYYTVNIEFDNDGNVLPGMSARCVVTYSERSDVLAVPAGAVNYDDEDFAYVYVVTGGNVNSDKLEKRMVKTGASDSMNVEIEEGLEKGEKVRVIKIKKEE